MSVKNCPWVDGGGGADGVNLGSTGAKSYAQAFFILFIGVLVQ